MLKSTPCLPLISIQPRFFKVAIPLVSGLQIALSCNQSFAWPSYWYRGDATVRLKPDPSHIAKERQPALRRRALLNKARASDDTFWYHCCYYCLCSVSALSVLSLLR